MWALNRNIYVTMLGKEVIGESHNCGSVAFVVSCVLFQEKYGDTNQIIFRKVFCT